MLIIFPVMPSSSHSAPNSPVVSNEASTLSLKQNAAQALLNHIDEAKTKSQFVLNISGIFIFTLPWHSNHGIGLGTCGLWLSNFEKCTPSTGLTKNFLPIK